VLTTGSSDAHAGQDKTLADVLLPNLDRVLVERIDIKPTRTVKEDIGSLILSNLT